MVAGFRVRVWGFGFGEVCGNSMGWNLKFWPPAMFRVKICKFFYEMKEWRKPTVTSYELQPKLLKGGDIGD